MLVIDAPRPIAVKRMFERFMLSNPCERLTFDFGKQLVDSLDHLLVVPLPVQAVFPRLVSEEQLHLASFRSTPLPALSWAVAESTRLALAGVRSK